MKSILKRPAAPDSFTVGIVTYIIRFAMFRKVFKKLRRAFGDQRVVVAVNGYYRPERQEEYLARLRDFSAGFHDIALILHSRPQALCRLWNEIILASQTEKIFIVNDDIDIAPGFGKQFIASGILDSDMALINESWSHFLISKKIIGRVGWFDERLVGVGGEDWDYEARLAFEDLPLEQVPMKGIRNLSIYTTDFSFGKDVERVEKKYTRSSSAFLHRKWRIAPSGDPAARFVRIWNNHVMLNEGFETPVFYDFERLKNPRPAAGPGRRP